MGSHRPTARFRPLEFRATEGGSYLCECLAPADGAALNPVLGVVAPRRQIRPLGSAGHRRTVRRLFLKVGSETHSAQKALVPAPVLIWTMTLRLGRVSPGLPPLRVRLSPTVTLRAAPTGTARRRQAV